MRLCLLQISRYGKLKMLLLGLIQFLFVSQCFSQNDVIPPERTISFETDQCSFTKLSISPNGKQLLFTILGDIYMVPSDGGNAVQLTRGMAMNFQPIWSPDGTKFAYFSDASGKFQVHVRNVDGKYHRTWANEGENVDNGLVWTPDGHCVVSFPLNINGQKYNNQYFLTGVSRSDVQLNTQRILRYTEDGNSYYYIDSAFWLCRYDFSLRRNAKIMAMPSGFRRSQAFNLTPDGNFIVGITHNENEDRLSLSRLDLKSGTITILVDRLHTVPSRQNKENVSNVSFSPDSKHVYFSYGSRIHKVDINTGADKIVPFKAKVNVDLGAFNYQKFRISLDSTNVKYVRSVSKRPDGKQLVFMALNSIYTMDVRSGTINNLVSTVGVTQFQPVYSPDSKWIAYVSWTDTSGGSLWRVPSKGGKPEQLSELPGEYVCPSWSHSGEQIAYIRASNNYMKELIGSREGVPGYLEVLNLKTGKVVTIDSSISTFNNIAFSLDDSSLIYHPDKGSTPQSAMMNQNQKSVLSPVLVSRKISDSKNEKVLAKGMSYIEASELNYFQQRSISPDQRYATFTMREDVYLVPLTQLPTKEPPVIFDQYQDISIIRFAIGVDPHWEDNGKTLAWNYGSKYYRVNPDKILAAALRNMESGINKGKLIKISIQPDETISISLKAPQQYGKGDLVLQNARIITIENGSVIENGTIVIRNGRISYVGKPAANVVPKGASVMDMSGKTIIPGMVDVHMHMGSRKNAMPYQRLSSLTHLAWGVTSGLDPASSYDSYGYAESLAAGKGIGPRLYTVGVAINQYTEFPIDDLEDAQLIAKKKFETGTIAVKQYNLSSREQKQWLLEACRKYKINMTNETEDYSFPDNVMATIAMIKDGSTGIAHNPEWSEAGKDVIDFIAKSKCYINATMSGGGYGPTGANYFGYTYWSDITPAQTPFISSRDRPLTYSKKAPESILKNPEFRDSLVRYPAKVANEIVKAGGNISLGSHAVPNGIGVHNNIWALVMGGMTPMKAIECATIVGARNLGLQDDIGSIAKGKIADLIILDANPLEDIHHTKKISYVMHNGLLYQTNTMDEVWPERKKCPAWQIQK